MVTQLNRKVVGNNEGGDKEDFTRHRYKLK